MGGDKLLGDFLRARRKAITPAEVGIPVVGRRRTPGLRREEVAMLADVSSDYYIRLEQGREHHPSEQVVDALAAALNLDAEATAYLHQLARPQMFKRESVFRTDRVHPNVIRLMEAWDAPAFVVNHRLDVLARNRPAIALYEGLDHSDNLLRLALLNPSAHEFYLDWEVDTRSKVSHLRAAAGAHQDDPLMVELIEELSLASVEFRRMWDRHDVRARTRAPVRFHHHAVGDVLTTMEVLSIDSTPGQKLLVFAAEPGSPSEEALALLAADRAHPAPAQDERRY
jgi:transcriptional regulator with XRE-family HTH domain